MNESTSSSRERGYKSRSAYAVSVRKRLNEGKGVQGTQTRFSGRERNLSTHHYHQQQQQQPQR